MNPAAPGSGVTLVLGGARSGKSAFAEQLAERWAEEGAGKLAGKGAEAHRSCAYLATAECIDDEMKRRIDAHRARRGDRWRTVEVPIELPEAIRRESAPGVCLLADCVTVWLGNLLHHGRPTDAARTALLESLAGASGPVVLVANEVGLGIVPDNPMARAFRDHAGRLNQAVAEVAQNVYFVAAGLPMTLKGEG